VLFPMEDPTLMWVANNIQDVQKFSKILIPALSSLNTAQSKWETYKQAAELKLPCPKSLLISSTKDIKAGIESFKESDFVIKPVTGSGSSGILYGNKDTTIDLYLHYKNYGPLLIQERIPAEGEGLGIGLLMNEKGECVASFAHKRLQQYPNSGGPSTDRISIENQKLIEDSVKLLKSLNWYGIGMVEWKMDIRDGIPKLMEINPRFWGSLELAIRSGVDFPRLFADYCIGNSRETIINYSVGIRCRWMFPGEILRYITQKKEKRESLLNFMKGFFNLSEEWDKKDINGWLASIICSFFKSLNPKYWKYVKRG